ncbi:MAG: hypothetical protein AAF808_00880 [Cyanobacteria bacterium P01_D01_bin.2]
MSVETKEYSGYWWFADNPGQQVTGNLSIDTLEGIKLKTIGSLLPQQALFSDHIDSPSQEILLGQAVDGSCITLVGTICTNRSGNTSANLSESTHIANLAVIGKRHFSSKDEILFSAAEARFDLLEEWLCKSGFTARDEQNRQGNLTKFHLEYEYPKVLEFDIDSIKAKFKTNYIFNWKNQNLKWKLGHKSFFQLSP